MGRHDAMFTISSELARCALDAAPDAMIFIDSAGVIRFVNRQVSAVFGYTRDEIIGQSVEKLMPERFRLRHVGHRERYRNNVRARPMGAKLELFGRRQDGSEFPVEISLSPIQESEPVLIAAAIRDVTDRKRTEAELMVARESADRANLGKSRFLATASHDLRQPLQTLALLNGSLSRMVTDPDAAEALSQQALCIGGMSRLLNALLDISKLESGAVKPEITDFTVAALFEELRSEFATLAASKGLRLETDTCQDTIHSDPSLVQQILRNLVSNAIKYTREGSVRLRCVHEETTVRIEVLDTGVGIPADQLSYIYDEFYQVGVPANSSRDGYGLGLSIVQRLVKLLSLNLDVRSEIGRGSAFSLMLPANRDHTTPARIDLKEPPPPRLQRALAHILLVEDDSAVRAATCMLLKLEGYHVTAVGSLAEALQEVDRGGAPDMVVTDYHLGGGQVGTQVISALRTCVSMPLKAVIMTGDTSSAVKELTRDANLRLASKPINADELLKLLSDTLAGQ
jgi:PAS domain S-box-containing protein